METPNPQETGERTSPSTIQKNLRPSSQREKEREVRLYQPVLPSKSPSTKVGTVTTTSEPPGPVVVLGPTGEISSGGGVVLVSDDSIRRIPFTVFVSPSLHPHYKPLSFTVLETPRLCLTPQVTGVSWNRSRSPVRTLTGYPTYTLTHDQVGTVGPDSLSSSGDGRRHGSGPTFPDTSRIDTSQDKVRHTHTRDILPNVYQIYIHAHPTKFQGYRLNTATHTHKHTHQTPTRHTHIY